MKSIFCFIYLLSVSSVFSQNSYSKSISLVSDNDLYTSTYRDRYYSNGLFVRYQFLGTSANEKLEKKYTVLSLVT
uniref:lipid A-modifier LpxR family protein n=1 Tax=Polaribacter sp. TaxID=1920175 RepID=UPI004047D54A